jgi:hypothetical protein
MDFFLAKWGRCEAFCQDPGPKSPCNIDAKYVGQGACVSLGGL